MRLNSVDYSPCPCQQPPLPKKRRKFRISRRIKSLAIPKYVTPKREPELFFPFKREIEIVRTDERVSTRLEQLAVPKVRKLVAARNEYSTFVNPNYMERFNKLIKKSLFTIYSHLANIRVPFKAQKPDRWTDAEWNAHKKWLENRAKAKWPFDFKLPDPFDDPITKLPPRKVLMKRPHTPWIKEYEKRLEQMAKENKKPDVPPPEVWKVKREKLKARPITPYIEEYGERLRTEAAEMKVLREERKAQLKPGPREIWDVNAKKKGIEEEYKARPKWVEKLITVPGWIKETTDKEIATIKAIQERQKLVGDRAKINKFGGRPRSLKLALATEEQRDKVKELLEVKKKEKAAILQGFQIKDKDIKKLLPTHKLFKSIEKLSKPRHQREKVKFPENYNRFFSYF